MITLYGIKNCDTVKRARTWLKENGVEYTFYNYKKDGVDKKVLHQAIKEHGWEEIINRRGTTWKQLPDKVRDNMDEASAITQAMENPSLIKRPLILKDGSTHLGFNPDTYKELFGK